MRTSVLINNFNNELYIKQCVESVLSQDTPPDEIIVYDDGSTDRSLSILESFQPHISLIKGVRPVDSPPWVNQRHAIESAFSQSNGDLIFLLDGDDGFTPEKVTHFLSAIQSLSLIHI